MVLSGIDLINVKLRKFDLNDIGWGDNILVIGKTKSGKTNIIKNILKRFEKCHSAVVVAPEEEGNQDYGEKTNEATGEVAESGIVPNSYIFEEYTSELGANILKKQKKYGISAKKYPLVFLLEDCNYDVDTWKKDKTLKRFLMAGRHSGITTIISMQSAKDFPPTFRNQIDWLFVLRENIPKRRQFLFENFPCGIFETLDIFHQVMNKTTQDYKCLVFKGKGNDNEIEKNCWWFKADILNPFTIGSEVYWRKHVKKYNPKFNQVGFDEENLKGVYRNKKNRTFVRVIREE